MKVRLRGVLTWQILVELENVSVLIPLPQVCGFVKIGHAWWSYSNCNRFWKRNHVYIPITFSGQRPVRTIKAEEKWREESSKRIGRPIFCPTTKNALYPSSGMAGVCALMAEASLLSAAAMAMAEKRSLVGEAPQAWRRLTSSTGRQILILLLWYPMVPYNTLWHISQPALWILVWQKPFMYFWWRPPPSAQFGGRGASSVAPLNQSTGRQILT